jgi:hypothetical protein
MVNKLGISWIRYKISNKNKYKPGSRDWSIT